jgi:hypothetical protein
MPLYYFCASDNGCHLEDRKGSRFADDEMAIREIAATARSTCCESHPPALSSSTMPPALWREGRGVDHPRRLREVNPAPLAGSTRLPISRSSL